MRVCIVTPAPPGSATGNRVTALRWARILRGLGHRVRLAQRYGTQRCELLVALHARRSAGSMERFHRERPRHPLILALTGTDLYRDIHRSAAARRSLELASRLVVLQQRGLDELPARLRGKARVIYQSARRPPGRFPPRAHAFEVCLLAHLRKVKDPFLAAAATRRLPSASRIRLLHLGAALEAGMEERARAEQARNPRYRWLGGRPRGRALRLMARCRLLVLTSRLEGGANAVSEALAAGVPVLSTLVSGSLGLLGAGYPGYFPVGDAAALARLLERAERDGRFRAALREGCRRRAPLVRPARERRSWRALLAELKSVWPSA